MQKDSVLLVEGADDARVIGSILERRGYPEIFAIKTSDGIESLLKEIPVFLKSSGIRRLGVVVDADFDIFARWESLKSLLAGLGYGELPDKPAPTGCCLVREKLPRFGVWLMPDNQIPGMLEDFVRLLIDPGDELREHAERIVDELPESEGRFRTAHRAKAVIHTWLAWRDTPGTPMGAAVNRKYLGVDNDHVDGFLGWLDRLYR